MNSLVHAEHSRYTYVGEIQSGQRAWRNALRCGWPAEVESRDRAGAGARDAAGQRDAGAPLVALGAVFFGDAVAPSLGVRVICCCVRVARISIKLLTK